MRRHLATQATPTAKEKAAALLRGDQLKGPLRQAAVEQLATVPEPWLDRLAQEDIVYVALAQNEDLSQTELITTYTPEMLQQDAEKAKSIVQEVTTRVDQEIAKTQSEESDPFALAMLEHGRAGVLAEKLLERFGEAGIGFDVKELRGEKPLLYLEQEHNVEPSEMDEYLEPLETEQGLFRSVLLALNGQEAVKSSSESRLGLSDDAILDPQNDILIIPYGIHHGKRLSEVSKKSYSSINGMGMDQHLGAHYWPNRLIVTDDDVVSLPSKKTGFHSVLLHETGHAIDKIVEEFPELRHVETIEALYARDLKRYQEGEKPFLTSRAMDNVEEYFAEAVEAYLTQPVENDKQYKPENDYQQLQERNPDLYAHVEKVLTFQPPTA
ncbi:MAG: hypothetical protein WC314_14105 [Vulcanimicrobiota bacterium]